MMRLVLLLGVLTAVVWADIPVNCTFDDVAGKWIFYEGSRLHDSSINCTDFSSPYTRIRVDLRYPDVVIDEFGNRGHWTMIYNEGFEITVNQRTFFAYFYYTQEGANVTSYCGNTFSSWSHDVTLRHWACFYGRKQSATAPKMHLDPFYNVEQGNEVITRENITEFVESINAAQTSWRAKVYDQFIGKTHEHMLKMSGGERSWLPHRPRPAQASSALRAAAATLPPSFDWRNVSGVNFVSPVRNQGRCGSCYAFSSMGMLEARLRIQTNNTLQVQLSPEDVISCSQLSQGCGGGFPFLVAGKYSKEFGAVNELCNPYTGGVGACTRDCLKYYTASYGYVGGYYGASNEELMMLELLRRGPLSVSFEVYEDFHNYAGGIYHHTGIRRFNPFEIVNHAVLLVGYGQDETGEKYWIVKNSWGTEWGEDGYFRIRRGTDEVSIESCVVEAIPIP